MGGEEKQKKTAADKNRGFSNTVSGKRIIGS